MKPILFMDIECYVDYFLIQFMSESGKTVSFEKYDGKDFNRHTVRGLLEACEVITFNGTAYDLPMLAAALYGANTRDLKVLSDEIIHTDIKPWKFYKSHCIPQEPVDHIDLIEVAPGIASLKLYGGRLHAHKMQDLPIEPDQNITPEQREELKTYCRNDLELTQVLYNKLKGQIDLRRSMSAQYGQDLRSKSDAQIAETVIISELTRKNNGLKPARAMNRKGTFNYRAPDFLPPSEARNIAEQFPFEVRSNGVTYMPKELEKLKVTIGATTYQLGMGGLHSTEKCQTEETTKQHALYDWDVASYYPSIILNCRLFPQQLGEMFLDVYREIVVERLQAKKENNKIKADALKIVVNGSFGKLGSQYSALYAPDLMVQVTVTGQLALLMLIEKLEQNGLRVVSGNTDGIVIKCPAGKEEHMKLIIRWWEGKTGFQMECTEYVGLYSLDVNNYIAICK